MVINYADAHSLTLNELSERIERLKKEGYGDIKVFFDDYISINDIEVENIDEEKTIISIY